METQFFLRYPDAYVLPDRMACLQKNSNSRWTLGYMSPEWSQSLGVASADMFAAYDYRYSIFVDDSLRIYNPGILFEKFYAGSSWALFTGTGQYKSRVQFGVPATEVNASPGAEAGIAFFKNFDDVDISLSAAQVSDREGHFRLNPATLQIERAFAGYKVANLGVSAVTWLGMVFRSDVSRFFNRTYTNEMLESVEASTVQAVASLETPTLLGTIFSVQYSSLGLSNMKEILKYGGAEWLLVAARTDLKESKYLELQWLNYHYDGGQAFKGQIVWPNKRLTELAIGVESYTTPAASYLAQSFENKARVFFRYNVNVSL